MKKKTQKTQKQNLKAQKVKPELPGGFRDAAPEDAILKNRLLDRVRTTFESFGFDPMETPSIERTDILTGGEKESQKIIFNVKSSKNDANKKTNLSLRFDLTVPLARFVAAHPDIPKPFKRYQIGQVFRGESPQAGRYREFTQADIDIVGAASADADSEIITAACQTLKNLGINRFVAKINNRKLLNGLPTYAGFPEKKLGDVLRVMDKRDLVGAEAVQKELKKIVPKKALEKINEFLGISGDTKTKLLRVRELLNKNAVAEEGIRELVAIARNLNAANVDQRNWQLDFATVRGLNYYTGPVFEIILPGAEALGSVFSGGRYDSLLATFTGQKIPAVGASLGVDRLLALLEQRGLTQKKSTTAQILIMNLSPNLKKEYFELAAQLRNARIQTAFYTGDDTAFQAQFAYAVKKGIRFVLLYGEREKERQMITIKNLRTREQKTIPRNTIVQYLFRTKKSRPRQ